MDKWTITCTPAGELSSWDEYGSVSIAFWAQSRLFFPSTELRIENAIEEPIETPFIKDYDAISDEGPSSWRERFDVSQWVVLQAYGSAGIVGGAVVAWNTPGVDMLEGRTDLAVLWDIRVHPDHRQRGVGHCLFSEAEAWARSRNCRELKIETQDINVAGCRFYARQGCELRIVTPNAYPDLPDEVQLIWYKAL